jgi:hypothetical protein
LRISVSWLLSSLLARGRLSKRSQRSKCTLDAPAHRSGDILEHQTPLLVLIQRVAVILTERVTQGDGRALPASAAMAASSATRLRPLAVGGLAAATAPVNPGVDVVEGADLVRWNVFGGLVIYMSMGMSVTR